MEPNNQQKQTPTQESNSPEIQSQSRQEQTDPQLTELKGFTDSSEDLEPTLTDGTKAPDKAQEERKNDGQVR